MAIECDQQVTQVWDTAVGRMLAQLPPITKVPGALRTPPPMVNATGELAAIASGNLVTITELATGRALRTVSHLAVVTAIAFAANGHDLITGSIDGTVLVAQGGSSCSC